jgi:epoxyqueuosine reductase QueG
MTATALPNLEAFASSRGLAAVGVADLDALREREPEAMAGAPARFPRGISLGIRLPDAVVERLEDRPTPLYFHVYRQANYALDRAAFDLALRLQEAGHAALPVPASQIVDSAGLRGLVSHRLLGQAAGVGWIGRSRLLVHPEHGARLRYASVLTDAPYEPGEPMADGCGDCVRCIEVCPAGAIGESSRSFDVEVCHRQLGEFRKLPGIGQRVCGLCVKACPGPGRG